MERHALNAQTLAALFEFRRAICRSNRAEIWKQRTLCRQTFQYGRALGAELDQRRFNVRVFQTIELFSVVANCPIAPIDVLRLEIGNVRLRSAQKPRELVKCLSFRIFFAGDDLLMFGQFDSSLLLVFDLRPKFFRQDRPGEPAHANTMIVKFP